MAKDNADMDDARRSAASSVKRILAMRGLELSQCGSGIFRDELPDFDPKSGYWSKPSGVNAKPPRWLVWIERKQDAVIARVPEAPGVDRIGFFNTAKGRVGGMFIRVVPVIHRLDGTWDLNLKWEWVLFFVLPRPLKAGSSGQIVDHFRPKEGCFGYLYNTDEVDPKTNKQIQKYEEPAYVAAGLFALVPPADLYESDGGKLKISYAEATSALRGLINVAPWTPNGDPKSKMGQ